MNGTSRQPGEWLRPLVTTRFAASLGEVALSYLLWRPRLERGERRMPALPDKPRYEDSTFAAASAVKPAFVTAFLEQHREWTKEDIDAAVDLAFAGCASLTDWMDALIRAFGISLEFDYDEPQVAIATAAGWSALTNRVDPDIVACFLLARAGHADDLDKLRNWGVATRVSDRDLVGILDQGTTDLHVHLGGTRSAQILWRNLLTGQYSVDRIGRYSLRTMSELQSTYTDEYSARVSERSRLQDLTSIVANPDSPLGRHWIEMPSPEPVEAGENQRLIGEALRRERTMLCRAWRDLLAAPPPEKSAGLRSMFSLEHQLDRYLFAKSIFLANHCQPEQSNPGLGVFRRYYQSVEPIWPSGKLAPARFEKSRRLRIRELAEYAAYIAQSRSLKRVELRMGPLERPRDYHQFFQAWAQVEDEFGLARSDLDVRFAIHFKRSLVSRKNLDRHAVGDGGGVPPLHKFLRELDRDSATLHTYRSGEEWAAHSWRIARVDFAGAERDIPPDVASFCMNLVRGEQDAIGSLKEGACDPELHRFWLLHADRETARAPRGRPALGLTCHAGEDYAHPLEGVYCIASAVKLLKMRAGDTIGHGLALGQDCAAFDRSRSPMSLTVRGMQFDALLWLYCQCGEMMEGTAVSALEPWLRQEAHDIYGPSARRVQSLRLLKGLLFEQRCGPVAPQERKPSEPCARFRHMEIWDRRCSEVRSQRVPVADIVYRLTPAIEMAQKLVLTDLMNSGIALEFNPSSNLRVSRSLSVRTIPFMRLIEETQGKILATINTDDPGTFGTRIENEHALVMRALGEAGYARSDALDIVRRMRDAGLQSVYWPRRRDREADTEPS